TPAFDRIVVGGASGVQTLNTNGKALPGNTLVVGAHGIAALVGSTLAPSLAVSNTGTIVVRGNTTVNGTLTTGVGSTLQLEGNGVQGTGQLTLPNLVNNGTIDFTSVGSGFPSQLTMSGGGAITNAPSGTITT